MTSVSPQTLWFYGIIFTFVGAGAILVGYFFLYFEYFAPPEPPLVNTTLPVSDETILNVASELDVRRGRLDQLLALPVIAEEGVEDQVVDEAVVAPGSAEVSLQSPETTL